MSIPTNPSIERWSEFTQTGMRRASPRRAALSSGARILVCSRSASRKGLVFIASSICVNCVLLPPAPTAYCLLFTPYCLLFTGHGSLLTAYCSLLTAHCSLIEGGNHDAGVSTCQIRSIPKAFLRMINGRCRNNPILERSSGNYSLDARIDAKNNRSVTLRQWKQLSCADGSFGRQRSGNRWGRS